MNFSGPRFVPLIRTSSSSTGSATRSPSSPRISTPPPMPSDPAAMLRERNTADGIHIDAQTSKPGWLGERLDVGYAIATNNLIAVVIALASGGWLPRPGRPSGALSAPFAFDATARTPD